MDGLLKKLATLHVQYEWDTIFNESSVENIPKVVTTSNNNTDKNTTIKKEQKKALEVNNKYKQFAKRREELTQKYFAQFNNRAFKSRLPEDLSVTWSKRMTKTAGFTRMKISHLSIKPRSASIELSIKVIDNEDRLQETLLHEMCHVAAFLLDGVTKPPHGDCFWKWARIAEKGMDNKIKITTCHSYEINKPFKFTCTNQSCGKVYGRHSKKGIDVERQFCGICRSSLEYSGKVKPDGTPQKTRAVSAFSLFVKEHYGNVKAGLHSDSPLSSPMSHGDVMRKLSKMYAEENSKSTCTETKDTDLSDVAKSLATLMR